MRYLIFPVGSAGDVHPFIGVAKALADRGHDVHVITSEHFKEAVLTAGLEFHALGTEEDFNNIADDPDLWHPRKAFTTIVRKALTPMYPEVLRIAKELHKPGETRLVASTLGFGVRNARDLLEVPMTTVHLAPAAMLSRHRMPLIHGAPIPQWAPGPLKSLQWKLASMMTDRDILPGLNAFRREHGLAPARDVIRTWWHSPDRVIGLWPEWFGPAQPDWPAQFRQTGFPMFDDAARQPLSAELDDWLAQGDPPVVFTPGSAMAHGQAFFEAAAGALRELGPMRGLLLTRYTETVPAELPANVRHFAYAPFSALLPRCGALVYHGGIGTCAQALRAGIPHVVMHMAHDQLDNLSRVKDLGVGTGVKPAGLTKAWLAKTLPHLLSDAGVKARCADHKAKFQPEQWINDTCKILEE
jgi:rhamnosyltransferase subunit B